MKYQRVVELSVREYLGIEDGHTAWIHQKYAIGIEIGNEVYDYKTLEKYNFLDRTPKGIIDTKNKKLVKGTVYAVSTACSLEQQKKCTDYKIKQYLKNTNYFTEEYINAEPKIKTLIKQKK